MHQSLQTLVRLHVTLLPLPCRTSTGISNDAFELAHPQSSGLVPYDFEVPKCARVYRF